MNRISAIALFAAASFATVHSASAQTTLTKTTVPFAFSVNGVKLPAGTYVVSAVTPDLLKISSTDHKHPNTVTVLTSENSGMNPHGTTKLVFNQYGGQYFLHEVMSPIYVTDAMVPVSRQEKKVEVEWASKGGIEPVLVAVK